MKIVLLVAASPTSRCGVGDYTENLGAALRDAGNDVTVEQVDNWSLGTISALQRKYAAFKDVRFHLQYPSLGMGNSLTPALLPLVLKAFNSYVTLHEFSIFSKPRKLIFLSHALLSKGIIFSNDYERNVFHAFMPIKRAPSQIIPIGNNIEVCEPHLSPLSVRRNRLVYFGQVGEDKGIDIFLETVKALRENNILFEAAMIGAVTDPDCDLVRQIKQYAADYDIELLFNRSAAEVSKELSASRIALLPFPDGISDKRGSALACLEHGLRVITKHSAKTPEWLKLTTDGIDDIESSARLCSRLLTEAPGEQSDELDSLLKQEISRRKWPNIANEHMKLYSA